MRVSSATMDNRLKRSLSLSLAVDFPKELEGSDVGISLCGCRSHFSCECSSCDCCLLLTSCLLTIRQLIFSKRLPFLTKPVHLVRPVQTDSTLSISRPLVSMDSSVVRESSKKGGALFIVFESGILDGMCMTRELLTKMRGILLQRDACLFVWLRGANVYICGLMDEVSNRLDEGHVAGVCPV